MPHTLAALNAASDEDFAAELGPVFENAPWIAEAAATSRPFGTIRDLFGAMRAVVERADVETRLALLRGHPELAGRAARSGRMTADSVAEQGGAGLDALSDAEYARFDAMNVAYRDRFGLPFILCVRRHGRASLLRTFEKRLANDVATEKAAAEAEMFRIAAIRVGNLVTGDGALATTGRISTHVLDIVRGRPAAGVAIELFEVVSPTETRLVARTATNAEGRTDAPLIGGVPIPIATYELRFELGEYHRREGVELAEPPFLDVVPVRFGVAEPEAHYHVPLVATPWSFGTYRGS